MVHIKPYWAQFLENAGNRPGLHQGDVTIVLASPVAGMREITVPSDAVSVAAEQGNVHGLAVELADGRRLFLPWPGVQAVIDAEEADGG